MDSASACAPVPGASSPNSLPELRGCDRVIIHAHLCATAWCIANCAAFGTTGTAERMGNSPTADMAMQCIAITQSRPQELAMRGSECSNDGEMLRCALRSVLGMCVRIPTPAEGCGTPNPAADVAEDLVTPSTTHLAALPHQSSHPDNKSDHARICGYFCHSAAGRPQSART